MSRSSTIIMWTTRACVGVGVIILAFVISSWLIATAPEAEVSNEPAPGRSVLVIESAPVQVSQQFTGYGVARAIEDADVPARVSSTVINLPATSRAGNLVSKGDLLVILDDIDFQEELTMARQRLADIMAQLKTVDVEEKTRLQTIEIAEQDLELAKRELDRVRDAVNKQAAMPREVDMVQKQVLAEEQALVLARADLEQTATRRLALEAKKKSEEASIRIANERVERCTITSPINGFIERIDVSQGENLTAGSRVARIMDPRAIEVPLELAASARGEVSVGDSVLLQTTGSRTRTWDARVARVSPQDDPSSRTMTVYAEVTQPMAGEHHLPPGAFVQGSVSSEEGERAWIVPRRSVRKDRLLVVRDGSVKSVPVSIRFPITGTFEQFDVPDRDWVVLDEPLEEGELIVLSPSRTLADGMRVEPVSAEDSLASVRQDSSEGGLQ